MTFAIRAFVLSLVVTGAAASNHLKTNNSDGVSITVKTSAMPIACCPPDDPNACGVR